MPVIGLLNNGAAQDKRDYVAAFQRGLREAGFVDGQNVACGCRFGRESSIGAECSNR
jgi:hypothetical protein